MVFCFFGMTQAAGDNMPPPGQPIQALQDRLDNEVFPYLVPTGVISMSAGSLDDIPDKLMSAKEGKPGKPPGEESDYKVTDLGTLDGGKKSSSAARDINGNGQVVGSSDDGQQTKATLWTVSAAGDVLDDPQSLITLDDQMPHEANAINQVGTVAAGYAGTLQSPAPVYWELFDGSIYQLDPLADFAYGVANDVNDDRKIVGYSTGFEDMPFVYAPTLWVWDAADRSYTAEALPTFIENIENDKFSMAIGINFDGDVVGHCRVKVGEIYTSYAVLWSFTGDEYNPYDYDDPCKLHVWPYQEYKNSGAYAITDRVNGSVKIIGERISYPAGISEVTVWELDLSLETCGARVDEAVIKSLGQSAHSADINNAGDVVGQDHSTRSTQPVVWPDENQMEMVVLPLLKGGSGIAEGISEGGQIVGWSEVRGGKHAVLWTKEQ
jgi:probable HAF family extracellular repeat protein